MPPSTRLTKGRIKSKVGTNYPNPHEFSSSTTFLLPSPIAALSTFANVLFVAIRVEPQIKEKNSQIIYIFVSSNIKRRDLGGQTSHRIELAQS